MTGGFAGRTALVTGGSRGIGRAVVLALARAGARVAINYRGDESAALETQALVEAGDGVTTRGVATRGVATRGVAPGATALFRADVADPAQVAEMVAGVEAALGPIDLLVTSAGISFLEPHAQMTPETWRRTMAVNVDGTAWPILAVKDGMIRRRYGRIVCLSSIAGLRPRENQIAYTASKAAVIAMVRSFAAALGPDVRVNAVAPGPTETDMMTSLLAEMGPERLAALPLGRMAEPEEVAEIVLFLLSDRSALLTGQTLVASGGEVMLP
jgi:3-oxoacyl-[acyl-carrier protein] reductase